MHHSPTRAARESYQGWAIAARRRRLTSARAPTQRRPSLSWRWGKIRHWPRLIIIVIIMRWSSYWRNSMPSTKEALPAGFPATWALVAGFGSPRAGRSHSDYGSFGRLAGYPGTWCSMPCILEFNLPEHTTTALLLHPLVAEPYIRASLFPHHPKAPGPTQEPLPAQIPSSHTEAFQQPTNPNT